MTHRSDFPYHEMSVEERLLLVEDIWDSMGRVGLLVARRPCEVPLRG